MDEYGTNDIIRLAKVNIIVEWSIMHVSTGRRHAARSDGTNIKASTWHNGSVAATDIKYQ